MYINFLDLSLLLLLKLLLAIDISHTETCNNNYTTSNEKDIFTRKVRVSIVLSCEFMCSVSCFDDLTASIELGLSLFDCLCNPHVLTEVNIVSLHHHISWNTHLPGLRNRPTRNPTPQPTPQTWGNIDGLLRSVVYQMQIDMLSKEEYLLD